MDFYVQVAGWSPTRANFTLLRHADTCAGGHASGNINLQISPRTYPTLPRALSARFGNHGAKAVAGRALSRGHYLSQERARHPLNGSAPTTHFTGARFGARSAARAITNAADHCRVDCDFFFRTKDRFGQFNIEAQQRVLAPAATRNGSLLATGGPTEEGFENVFEAEASPAPLAAAGSRRVHAHVVLLALFSVR